MRGLPFAAIVAITMAIAAFAPAASAQDVLTIGTAFGSGDGPVEVPVFVRDVNGTPLGMDAGPAGRIQSIAFRVTYAPASAVDSIVFSRAGVLASLTPLYETSVQFGDGISYVATFAQSTDEIPFTLNAASPGNRVGTLSVTFEPGTDDGTVVTLTIEPATAILANQGGTVGETTANGFLALNAGSVTVGVAETETSISSSANPSYVGQSVTFTANVTSAEPGSIAGTATFKDGGSTLGTVPVSDGEATFTTSALTQGTHSITVEYNGDGSFLASASAPLSQTVNAVPFGPPPVVEATAASPTQVNLTWVPVPGAISYEIYRKSGATEVLAGSSSTPDFSDYPLQSGEAYFYRIRTVGASATSAFSVYDPAVTFFFFNNPLVPGETPVRAIHITELRSMANKFLSAAGVAPVVFTDPSLTGTAPKAIHIEELREAINAARAAVGLAAPAYTDATLVVGTTLIKAAHVEELRSAME